MKLSRRLKYGFAMLLGFSIWFSGIVHFVPRLIQDQAAALYLKDPLRNAGGLENLFENQQRATQRNQLLVDQTRKILEGKK